MFGAIKNALLGKRSGGGGGTFGGGGASGSWGEPEEIKPQAEQVIREFLPDSIPEEEKKKPLHEIAKYENENGENVGVSALGDAYNAALDYYSAQSPAYSDDIGNLLLDLASLSSGSGTFYNQLQNFMIGFDKYGKSLLMPNVEFPGMIFFSRPRLCLQSSNIRNVPVMMPLDTSNPTNIAFALRCLLDTNLIKDEQTRNYQRYSSAANICPLFNSESPWLVPLSNAITSFSGLPDFNIDIETTPGGWFKEAQSYAVGSSDFSEGCDITCEFREIPGGIIHALFFYWMNYIRNVTRGTLLAYPDDIDGQIINYTVSIYFFMMDPSMLYITRWAKCTGCFPTSLNLGSIFSKSQGSYAPSDAAQRVSVTFKCNKVEFMKPECLLDFNTLAVRYCPDINRLKDAKSAESDSITGRQPVNMKRPGIPDSAFANFCGLPFIVSDPNGYRLIYRQSEKDLFSNPVIRRLIAWDVARSEKEWSTGADNSTFTLYQKYTYGDFYNNDVTSMKYADIDGQIRVNPFSFDEVIKSIQNGTFVGTDRATAR